MQSGSGDRLLPCSEGAAPVTCGAKLEIFLRRSVAKDRERELSDTTKERVTRRGALLLRVSPELPHERATLYRIEFLSAIDELVAFRELARVDRSDA